MSRAAAAGIAALAGWVLLALPAGATALPGVTGGAAAPTGAPGGTAPVRSSSVRHPILRRVSIPSSSVAPAPPAVSFEVQETGVRTVNASVTVTSLTSKHLVLNVAMGWVRTGRLLHVGWPRGASLSAGPYAVNITARDHQGARASGVGGSRGTRLNVSSPPAPPPTPAPTPAGVPTPAQTVAAGAVFPLSGPHTFGGPEDRFGAPRGNHVHQGQDVLGAEGTPVVAPMTGTVFWTSYQAEGAGYYAVEHTSVGFDLMFAHCQAGSLAVSASSAVRAGQLICREGQTGDATAPHLHFEMWVGGWWAPGGYPIDPLPYLQAWER